MTSHVLSSAAGLLLLASSAVAQTPPSPASGYPETRRGTDADEFHGTRVGDPYRWLEQTDAPETREWVIAQNRVTMARLAALPGRDALRERLTKLWNYPKYSAPMKRGGRYFSFQNTGLQNQSVYYVREALDKPARVLIDPNTMSARGTVALSSTQPSPNGKLVAYSVSASGSDWQEFRVRDVATGRDMRDTLRWVKFSGASWTLDNKGFFYSRYSEPAAGDSLRGVVKNQKLYYHRVGTPQSRDLLIYERPDEPDWGFGAEVTEDGLYCVITVWRGTDPKNRLFMIDLDRPNKPKVTAPVVRLIDRFDATYEFVGNSGPLFILRTTLDAPRGRLIAVDNTEPRAERWRMVVPQGTDALASATMAGDRIAVTYLKDAFSVVRFYSLGGLPFGGLRLPGLGTVTELQARPNEMELFFTYATYLSPPTVYRYVLGKKEQPTVWRRPVLPADVSGFETRQIFATGKDGTRIPIFVTVRKGMALDGNNPTLLYAYGGFNVSLTPSFSPAVLAWVEAGGVYAVANLRGGGEYGEEWHLAGTGLNKQNVFNDFVAAAEHLIAQKYTRSEKLAIQGGSNGGLLVGAAMTQRPELFAVALPAVGVMDMLRFHKFTIGWAWTSDYGSPDNPAQFKALYAYSPVHNLRAGTRYPATLITTADHDDRVVPGHSYKFAAALQAAQAGPAPVLIRVETEAGHGEGKPTSKRIEETTDVLAFAAYHTGLAIGGVPPVPPIIP